MFVGRAVERPDRGRSRCHSRSRPARRRAPSPRAGTREPHRSSTPAPSSPPRRARSPDAGSRRRRSRSARRGRRRSLPAGRCPDPPPPPPPSCPSSSTTRTITPTRPPPPPIAIPGPNEPGMPNDAPRRSDTWPVRNRAPRRNRTPPGLPTDDRYASLAVSVARVPHDLVIRGGRVVDGTGAPARVADVAIDDGVITEIGTVDGRAAPRARRRRPARHARLRRHPHASRRAARVGSDRELVVLARRDDDRRRQLRGDVRARAARRPRVPRRDDGVGRGHPAGEHPRRPPVGLGGLRRLPRLARPDPQGRARRRHGRPLARFATTRCATARSTPTPRRRPTSSPR